MKIDSEQAMLDFGKNFAQRLLSATSTGDATLGPPSELDEDGEKVAAGPVENTAIVIELIGDVGTGKTTFVRGLARGLGIKEPVTSPSFTISKSYALPQGGYLIHYDFYRLNDPGLMVDDLEENLKNPKNIVVIEWGESVANLLPENHLKINLTYNDTGSRDILFL